MINGSDIAQTACFALPLVLLSLGNEADREFVAQIYLENRKLMYCVAKRYFDTNQSDIDDAIGGALERICKNCGRLRLVPTDKLSGYIVKIVGNVCRDMLRKENRRRMLFDTCVDLEMLEEIPDIDDSGGLLFDQTIGQELLAAFCELPKRDQELIRMRYIDDTGIGQIADDLGVSEGAVRTALTRAKKHMQQIAESMKNRGRSI